MCYVVSVKDPSTDKAGYNESRNFIDHKNWIANIIKQVLQESNSVYWPPP